MSQITKDRTIFVVAPRIDGSVDEDDGDGGRQRAGTTHRAWGGPIDSDAFAAERFAETNDAPVADAAPPRSPVWNAGVRRGLKVAAAVALVGVFGVRPLQGLLQAASVEAVVNGRVVTLRAPIDGEVVAAPSDSTAWSAVKGAPVLRIHNANADRTRLDDLRLQVGRLDDERPAIISRIERASEALRKVEAQTDAFAQGRIRQIENRVAALDSDLATATAKAEEAKAAFERSESLFARGVTTVADLARANRDNLSAAAAERGARQRAQETRVELDVARSGTFLGDSYNDRPGSAQRADELRMRVDDMVGDLSMRDAQRTRLAAELAAENARFVRLADAEVALPISGRVWEVLVASGERVRRDQDLVRVLDCSTAVVSADVEETVYNRLRVGAPARFRPADGGADIPGVVVNLTGMAGVAGNFAIHPQGLQKQTYHVTVSVPAIADGGDCGVGRTGRVYFDKDEVAAAPQLGFGLRR